MEGVLCSGDGTHRQNRGREKGQDEAEAPKNAKIFQKSKLHIHSPLSRQIELSLNELQGDQMIHRSQNSFDQNQKQQRCRDSGACSPIRQLPYQGEKAGDRATEEERKQAGKEGHSKADAQIQSHCGEDLMFFGNHRAEGDAHMEHADAVEGQPEHQHQHLYTVEDAPSAHTLPHHFEQFPDPFKDHKVEDLSADVGSREDQGDDQERDHGNHSVAHAPDQGVDHLGKVEVTALDGQSKRKIPLIAEKVVVVADVAKQRGGDEQQRPYDDGCHNEKNHHSPQEKARGSVQNVGLHDGAHHERHDKDGAYDANRQGQPDLPDGGNVVFQ